MAKKSGAVGAVPESNRQIVMLQTATLQPNAKNSRTHSDSQVDQIAASIREFGFNNPVLVDENTEIIAGHGRVMAATKLGLEHVPCIRLTHLSQHQKQAYLILESQLKELTAGGFNLDLLGFNENEMYKALGMAGREATQDEVPAPPDKATTQLGDLWILGNHRLLCGDSSSPQDLDRLLGGQRIHLVNMDPPYNVKVEPRSNNAIAAGNSSFAATPKKSRTHHQSMDLARDPGKSKPTTTQMRAKDRPLANDFVTDDAFDILLDAWFGNASRVLLPGRSFYIWGGYANCANYPPYLKKHELYFSQAIIWDKMHPVLTRKDFMGAHEWCFYGWKEGAAHQWLGPTNATDLWQVKKVNPQSMVHLTEKPVELAARAMEYSSREGENVLDLFGGSGSTMMGAEQTGRHAFSMELDPPYCDVIVARWEKFTGKKAELESATDSAKPTKTRRTARVAAGTAT